LKSKEEPNDARHQLEMTLRVISDTSSGRHCDRRRLGY
jgi:hypothetical protein